MGHIKLVVPVVHIWFFKSLPNKIGYLLGLSSKKLETIIYYERYVVIQPGILEESGTAAKNGFVDGRRVFEIFWKILPKENQSLEDDDPQSSSLKWELMQFEIC